MNRQTTGILFSYTNKSAYHDSCVPKPTAPPPEPSAPGKLNKDGDYNNCNAVIQDVIWKQSVHAERRCLKNWEEDWGFLTDYDAKGNIKEKEELPEKSNMFSDSIPNTNSGNYGNRLVSDAGKTMQSLEFKFFSEGRRKKLPKEMICY
ncbi:hypothetical protein PoB_006691100 [Plakobranchus ocellatus]|uniref:Uncharacterized protein n=1 Tax=Plakobranchus ocellatus TaxID=259542 RepID=A0AAV4D8D1_9GAST|nr:hypothetical protein PoB_006691100 [Plakobranchus ocellatus]